MRSLLTFLIAAAILSCTNTSPDVVVKAASTALPIDEAKIKGIYAGQFEGSLLTIVVKSVNKGYITGYSEHKEVKRELAGVADVSDGQLHLYLAEPGNLRYDGKFHLQFDSTLRKGTGSWKPYVKGEEINFSFEKTTSAN